MDSASPAVIEATGSPNVAAESGGTTVGWPFEFTLAEYFFPGFDVAPVRSARPTAGGERERPERG
jgi:hypothetical protein